MRHQTWSVDHRTIGADQGPGNVKINQKLDVGSVLGSEAGLILSAERDTTIRGESVSKLSVMFKDL